MTKKIFFSYAHEDELLLVELEKHLSGLKQQGFINCWSDLNIAAGEERDDEINEHLDTADILLLLISPDFISSDSCYKEMSQAMERHKDGGARVIPVILRGVDWSSAPFRNLEPLPRDGIPIKGRSDQDEAFAEVGREIRKIVGKNVVTSEVTAGTHQLWKRLIGRVPNTDPRAILQRESLVHEIYSRLTQPGVSAMVLTGLDGIGKSTIAALVYSYAWRQQIAGKGPFTADPIWIKVDSTVTMMDLSETLFEKLGRHFPDFGKYLPDQQAITLFQALNKTHKPFLIVLDQFDQLLDAQTGGIFSNQPALSEWLNTFNSRQCRCRILITSRYFPPDHLSAFVQRYILEGLNQADGVELLRKREVKGSEEHLQDATKYCGGNALALKLLASELSNRNVSLQTFLKDSRNTQYWKGNVARNLVDSIYTNHLDELQRNLLNAFSIYREAVLLDAAEAILENMLRFQNSQVQFALDVLLRQSLLQAVGEGRYQVQILIAEYIQTYIIENSEHFDLQTAHYQAARYYLQEAVQHEPPAEERANIEDVHCLIEAIWHLCQARQWTEAYTLMYQQKVYEHLMLWGENRKLLDLLLLFLPASQWHTDRSQEASIYNSLGMVYNLLGRKTEALNYYERALVLVKEIEDRHAEGVTLRHIGRVYNALGEKKRALQFFENALSMLKDNPERGELGKTYERLGRVYYVLGRREQAKDAYEQALKIYNEVGNTSGKGTTLSYLGRVHSVLGQAEEGLRYCKQGLQILRNIGDRRGEDRALDNLGRIYHVLERYDKAQEAYEQALKVAAEVGDRGGEGIVLQGIGNVYISLEQKEKAQKTFEQALTILREVKDKWREGMVLSSLASVSADLGQKEIALKYYKEAINVRRRVDDYEGENITLCGLGKLYLNQQDYEVALACFLSASTILEKRQLPGQDLIQQNMGELSSSIGEGRFVALLERVKPRASELVGEILMGES
jgi:tetratricopeptide (TPR) repeat protein